MKLVRKTITLPKPIYDYAKGRVDLSVSETGRFGNFSAFVSELIAKDKKAHGNGRHKEVA